MQWEIIDTGRATAEENMLWDRQLLKKYTASSAPLLRFYEWSFESASYGYFLKPPNFSSLNLVRRPTGGGVIFHHNDFTFSAFIPASHPKFTMNTMENYKFINELVLSAINSVVSTGEYARLYVENCEMGCIPEFCMAHPVHHDIMLNGLKIGGGAQRRTREGYLHQGTLNLQNVDTNYLLQKGVPIETAKTIQAKSTGLVPDTLTPYQLESVRKEIKNYFTEVLNS